MAALAAKPSGLSWSIRHSELADEVVQVLYADLQASQQDLPPLALIATGGYGRSELSTYSDIDITVIPSDEASPVLDRAIRILFQDLHWAFCTALHMDVGYAYRLISDAPGLDAKSRTGLMDMRLVAGSHELGRQLEEALVESFEVGEFILAKVTEREQMFHKYHDTPLVVEPNLKEGAGGMRCFHCANWLREAIGERASRPSKEYDQILRIRNLLHLNAGKHQDMLSRQRQAQIADQLDVDMYELMASVVASGAALHDHYRSAREKITQSRFALSRGVLAIQGEARLVGQPDGGEAAVGIALGTLLGLRVADIAFAQTQGVRGPAVMYAISTGETTLRNMDRCGLLGQLLPELVACKTLIPTDAVHDYTVFEHTMRVVRHLENLTPGSFLGDLKDSVNDMEPLYLAALLHDVGKICPEEDHSVFGAGVASVVCQRWRLADGIREIVEWLVAEHLTMARFIRVRDIMNPQTVEEFATIVGDLNRLTLITLLTYADVSAVAEGAWTPAQDTFLRELFVRTDAVLRGDGHFSPDPAVYRQRLLRQLKSQKEDEGALQAFVESLPSYYLTSTHAEVIRLHMGFVKKAKEGEPTVELFHRSDISATEITICTLDAPGLLSKVLGVFYAYDLSVGGIRACTTMTNPAVALDVFTVSFSARPVPTATIAQVTAAILDVLEGRVEVEDLLIRKGKDPFRKQHVFKHTYIEGAPGILEIRSPRGRGMPYRFSRLIADQGWNVVAARVGQWAGNATAAFYLLGPGGRQLSKAEVDELLHRISKAQ
jgi:[protein-PII] uridylyltransferase